MLSSLSVRVGILLDVRPGEGRLVTLLVTQSSMIGLLYSFSSSASAAIFLDQFGASGLPWVYIGSGLLMAALGVVYSSLQARVSFTRLLPATLAALLVGYAAVRAGMAFSDARWLSAALFFLHRVGGEGLAGLPAWAMAERLFDIRQGKRLFGLIGTGDILGAIVAGVATPPIVAAIGAGNLLWVCVLVLGVYLGLQLYLLKTHATQLREPGRDSGIARQRLARRSPRRAWDGYVVSVVLFAALAETTYDIVNATFLATAEARYPDRDRLASFLGLFTGALALLSLAGRAVISGRLLHRTGLRIAVLLPGLLMSLAAAGVVAVGVAMGPTAMLFGAVCAQRLLMENSWDSVFTPSLLLLYQPMRPRKRFWLQTVVDSVAKPLATTFAGAWLLVYQTFFAFDAVHLSGAMLAIALAWTGVGVLVGRRYVGALMAAVAGRLVDSFSTSVTDPTSVAVLERGLTSEHAGTTLYCLRALLDSGQPPGRLLVSLLEHPAAEVRQEALARIETLRVTEALGAARVCLRTDVSPEVRAAALRACAAVDPDVVLAEAASLLDAADLRVRTAAMVALQRYGGPDGRLVADERLRALVASPSDPDRSFAATVIGAAGGGSLSHLLGPLLTDRSPAVRRAALDAAATVQDVALWPLVVETLRRDSDSGAAAATLVAAGASAVPALAATLDTPDTPRDQRRRIIGILGRLGEPHALELLRRNLKTADLEIRHHALRALRRGGYRARGEDRAAVEALIAEEVSSGARFSAALADLRGREVPRYLLDALGLEIDLARERILHLFSVVHGSTDLDRAVANFRSDDPARRAYALELLDHLVPGALVARTAPLLEDLEPHERLRRLAGAFPQPRFSPTGRLSDLVTLSSRSIHVWTQACCLHAIGALVLTDLAGVVAAAAGGSDFLIRETAARALPRLRPEEPVRPHHRQGHQREAEMLLTLERVLLLKRAPFFESTPDHSLLGIAASLAETDVPAGTEIIKEGDLGATMYVVVEGEVRVEVAGRVATHRGPGDVFGELSVLDPQPRMATVVAETEVRLLGLDRELLFEAMADRPEVAQGVIRFLCRRYREGQAP